MDKSFESLKDEAEEGSPATSCVRPIMLNRQACHHEKFILKNLAAEEIILTVKEMEDSMDADGNRVVTPGLSTLGDLRMVAFHVFKTPIERQRFTAVGKGFDLFHPNNTPLQELLPRKKVPYLPIIHLVWARDEDFYCPKAGFFLNTDYDRKRAWRESRNIPFKPIKVLRLRQNNN